MGIRISLILGVVSIMMAGAAAGQTAAAIKKSNPAGRTAGGRPDLEGVWSFATLTPLERPAELAGKTTLTKEEAAAYAKRRIERDNRDNRGGGNLADVSRAYNESWYDFGTTATTQTSLIIDPPDGKLPAMTAEAQQKAAARAKVMARAAEGPEDRPLWERCILGFNPGPPIMPSGYNNNLQIFETRNTFAILNEMVHSARIVPLDGRPHASTRQWLGDSRGHWEGATMVIDTVNFTNNGTGTIGLRVGMDENLHLVERFTRRDANTLIYEFTVTDPTVWTKPWTASVPMTRSRQPIYEYACHEGNYGMTGILSGARTEEKAAAEAAKKAR